MNKLLLTLIFTGFIGNAFSQRDTIIYYGRFGKIVPPDSNAVSCDQVTKKDLNTFELRDYWYGQNSWHGWNRQNIQKVNDTTFLLIYGSQKNKDTTVRIVVKTGMEYLVKEYEKGKLARTGISLLVLPIIKESKWTYYYPQTGLVRSEEYYEENQMISNRNWKKTGEEGISNVFTNSDTMPKYQDGDKGLMNFLTNEIKYPADARQQNIQGRVVIQFVVMEDGKVDGINILVGKCLSLDNESIRVVKLTSGKWKPGIINGKPVRIYFTLPISFKM